MSDSDAREPLSVVQTFYANLQSAETLPAALALLDENFVLHSPRALPWGGDYTGPAGFIELRTKLRALVSPENDAEIEYIPAGNHVLVRAPGGRFRSVITGESAPTAVAEIFEVRDGRIVDMDIYYKDYAAVSAVATDSER